jgi:hypothetical protein
VRGDLLLLFCMRMREFSILQCPGSLRIIFASPNDLRISFNIKSSGYFAFGMRTYYFPLPSVSLYSSSFTTRCQRIRTILRIMVMIALPMPKRPAFQVENTEKPWWPSSDWSPWQIPPGSEEPWNDLPANAGYVVITNRNRRGG